MKGKMLNKTRVAGAVMLATVGVAAGTAQADSLLAPVVINDTTAGFQTYFAYKVKGSVGFTAPSPDRLHYIWIRKGTSILNLYDPTGLLRDGNGDQIDYTATPCIMENTFGKTSKNDMIFQQTSTYGPGSLNRYPSRVAVPGDQSVPSAYPGNFVGMTVISDFSNIDEKRGAPEGDMSGFAYIVNTNNGDVADYKLLNNHHTAAEGDFSIGFISKTAVDFAWLGTGVPGVAPFTEFQPNRVKTGWTVAVTGPDMAKHSGSYNNIYGLTVLISQDQKPGEDSPQNTGVGSGGYDNDERPYSGETRQSVTCMAALNVTQLASPFHIALSGNGGWIRKSIIPQPDAYALANTPKEASGAIVYRSDSIDIDGPGGLRPDRTMQVETGGHLAPGANHVNRPY